MAGFFLSGSAKNQPWRLITYAKPFFSGKNTRTIFLKEKFSDANKKKTIMINNKKTGIKMKKLTINTLKTIGLLFITSGNVTATDLLIRVQDDDFKKGLNVKITIPKTIDIGYGPSDDKIKIVAEKSKHALKDGRGNFMEYLFDKSNRIVPHLYFKGLASYNNGTERVALISTEPDGVIDVYTIDDFGYIKSGEYRYRLPSRYKRGENIELEPLDKNFNYFKSYKINEFGFFDSVSTFGTVWSVFNMYTGDINFINDPDVSEIWNNRKPTKVYPCITEDQFNELMPQEKYMYNNAFHTEIEDHHYLVFFPLQPDKKRYTSGSFDVVAHETGHNVLSILRPDMSNHDNESEIGAFHESFGDLSAYFALSSIRELAEKVIEVTKGNLKASSFFSVLGEKIAERDAAAKTDLSKKIPCEIHAYSELLTRAVYGILADAFLSNKRCAEDDYYPIEESDEVELLMNTARDLRRLFLRTVIAFDIKKDQGFAAFGRKMERITSLYPEQHGMFRGFIVSNFQQQGIDITDKYWARSCIKSSDTEMNTQKNICCTYKIRKDKLKREKNEYDPGLVYNFQSIYISKNKNLLFQ